MTAGASVLLALLGVVLLPAVLLGVAAEVVAIRLGWNASRLRNFAAVSLVLPVLAMLVEWSPAAPLTLAWAAAHEAVQLRIGAALVDAASLYVPIGLVLGLAMWATYQHNARHGTGASLAAGQRHQEKHQRRQRAAAVRRTRGAIPLTRGTDILLGSLIEEDDGVPRGSLAQLSARHPEVMAVPLSAVKKHLTLVGDTGVGKTVTLTRLSAGIEEAAWSEYRAGIGGRPLVIFADCKGGPAGVEDGERWCDAMVRTGLHPSRVGLWPSEDRLDIWRLPAADLTELLVSLIAASHVYHDELRELAVHLVCAAPVGTPTSSADFLSRFDATWLRRAWKGHETEQRQIDNMTAGRDEALATSAMRYTNLLRKVGGMLDAGRDLADFDAIYCTVDGTRRQKEATAQAAALIRLVTELLTRPGHGREVYLLVDEYSAVAGGGDMVSLVNLAERVRSLGGHLIASAQSWYGLGPDDDQRARLVATCAGGRLLMRTPEPERLSRMSGTKSVAEQSRHISTQGTQDEGSERVQHAWRVDPDRVRQLDVGDLVWAVSNQARWGHVQPVPPRVDAVAAGVVREALPPAPQWDRVPLAELEASHTALAKRMSNGVRVDPTEGPNGEGWAW